ncbi:Metalloendoproteinase protein [Vigna angularis]|uniref:Metalloendoproteinase protein n=1 Tax=Phaseolus angularis TaxID=3914 RepID=A0A8T0JWC3_PHAAN|nr:Metalloendoproteinase protein [Vigna angularis]
MSLALKPLLLFLVLCALNPLPSVESAIPFITTLQNLRGISRGQNADGVGILRIYLKSLGYQVNEKSPSDNNFDANDESALKQYQAFHGLHTSGVVDDQTIETMSLPRCGLPDITATPNPNPNGLSSSPPQNYSYFPGNPKWSKFNLKYRVTANPSNVAVNRDVLKQILSNALNTWRQNNIAGFQRLSHGDGNPFDGRGGVLAHAFAPQDGRMHLDADERWSTTGISPTIDLETVCLHELGHNLGLGHSNDPNAVMAPTYAGVRRNLRQDDKDGLNNLYGF